MAEIQTTSTKDGVSQTADLKVTTVSSKDWKATVKAARESGEAAAQKMRSEGRRFVVDIVGPRTVRAGDSVKMAGVTFDLDWKAATRLEMVELARQIVDRLYLIGDDTSAGEVLAKLIEGHKVTINQPGTPRQ